MKIYDFRGGAPSPRKVRTFLAEKGIDVAYESVDIHERENRTPEFKKKNPLGSVPVLELGDVLGHPMPYTRAVYACTKLLGAKTIDAPAR